MSAGEWAVRLLAVGAGIIILFLIFQSAPSLGVREGSPSLTLKGPPSAFAGEKVNLFLDAPFHGGEKIVIEGGGNVHEYSCETPSCPYTISISFTSLGTNTIYATAGNQRAEWVIFIKEKTPVCLDGTPEGECSMNNPPSRCVNQKLLADCTQCGCPPENVCENGTCIMTPSLKLSLSLGKISSPLYTTSLSTFPVHVKNDSAYAAHGLFVLRLSWYDASQKKMGETFQQILIDALSYSQSVSFDISAALPSMAKFGSVELFSEGGAYTDDGTKLHQTPFFPLIVMEDFTSPLPPSSLTYFPAPENGIILSWQKSPSTDVQFYLIYQQNAATGGFTTYSILTQTPMTTYTISPYSPTESLAYVVSARDYAGNESSASQPLVVSAS
jgi:hypothetical protein